MQWTPCIVLEFRWFHAAWRNGTLLNAVDFMQHDWMQWIHPAWLNAVDVMQHGPKHPIECSGFHAASLNADYSMHFSAMDPDCMQWSPCSEAQCIQIEWSAFYAAWPNAPRLNAVYSLHCDWMQCTPCSVFKCIPIECSGVYAAWINGTHWM